jgi:cell division protease FtsH
MTRVELEKKMAVPLGGRAAEQLVFGEISTGAADDFARVTDIARAMVLRYSMSGALGSVAYDRDRRRSCSRTFRYRRSAAAAKKRRIPLMPQCAHLSMTRWSMRQLYFSATALLDRTAATLLETETLNEPGIEKLKRTIVREEPAPARVEATERSGATVAS